MLAAYSGLFFLCVYVFVPLLADAGFGVVHKIATKIGVF